MTKGNPVRVLLVDDEGRILEQVGKFLESCGYDVVTAESGHKALASLKVDACRIYPQKQLTTDGTAPALRRIARESMTAIVRVDDETVARTVLDYRLDDGESGIFLIQEISKSMRLFQGTRP